MIGIIIIATVWIVCGVIDYGWSLACNQRQYPMLAEGHWRRDQIWSAVAACLGPFSLFGTVTSFSFHGFMFRKPRQPRIRCRKGVEM